MEVFMILTGPGGTKWASTNDRASFTPRAEQVPLQCEKWFSTHQFGFIFTFRGKNIFFLGNMLSQIGQLVKKSGNWWKHQKENYRILASPAAAILGQSSSMSPSDGQGGTGLHKVDQPEDSGQGISSCRWDPRHKVFILHTNNWLFLHWECYEMNHVFQIHMLKP